MNRFHTSGAERATLAALLLSTLLTACGGGNGGRDPILGSGVVGSLPPTVTLVTPLANAVSVPVGNRTVTATFNKPLQQTSVSNASVQLVCGAATVGVTTYVAANNTVSFTANADLPPSTLCTAALGTGIKDLDGNPLASPYSWSFTTGLTPDTTPPAVSSIFPATNAAAVPNNTRITVSFSEPIDPLTLTAANVRLACPSGTTTATSLNYVAAGNVLTVTPAASLPVNTACTVTLGTGVKDLAGNGLASAYVWGFTTGTTADLAAPTVISNFPLANASGVPVNTQVNATFNEAMDPQTMNASNVRLVCPAGNAVAAGVGYAVNGNTVTLTPASNLPAGATCTATIGTGVKDLAGNAMAAAYSWSFNTSALNDTTAPTVTSSFPQANATNVPTTTLINAGFSETMDPLSITTATFKLACPAVAPVTGTVGYAPSGSIASFTPNVALPAGTVCTATIGTGVKDVAGNAMTLPYSWSFTTGVTAAGLPPTITATFPSANAVGVATNAAVTANFSGAMNPLTLSTASFKLTCPGATPVAGVVTYSVPGNSATFTPNTNLPSGSTCTASVSNSAKDVAGNSLVAGSVANPWSFTTAAVVVVPPSVNLGSAAAYGMFGGSAGMTNSGILTLINGNIGTTATGTSSITGFHDTGGDAYTETPLNAGTVNGTIYSCTNSTTGPTAAGPNAAKCAIATQGRLDAQTAYLALAALPPGANPGANLGGLTLAPGTYTAPGGSFMVTGADLTLDAQGDTNAVFVFQMATTLTVGGPGAAFPRNINLAGGAQAKNVFWQVGSFATINAGGGGSMVGTIIAQTGAAFSTAGSVNVVRLNGRVLSLGASVTLVNTVINVP